ncbi:MAG TPA: TetR/AcrR family transcriptional regulator [Acetobacteraceae bacterium]|nr:TetR/AcrR family transcriptional regulator [Acetobacteraceae bacterium]
MTLSPSTGLRGPAEHERREQIIAAADEHFRHYGYSKTTVADLAKAIGLSTAYIYKFFDSKRAIGEAVCDRCLTGIRAKVAAIANEPKPASDRLRRVVLELTRQGAELFFNERKMHDIVASALAERWGSVECNEVELHAVIRRIVQDGRESGEFERKTPVDEACRAILLALEPVKNPLLLERRFDTLEEDAALLAGLVLRSLAA